MTVAARRQRLFDELAKTGAEEPRLYRAPGRVNIVGEHTDYNEGLVLPTTTALYTWIAAAARRDGVFNINSLSMDESCTFNLHDQDASARPGWSNYLLGVVSLLKEEGIELGGADVIIDSDLPIGGGLSSSAALEVGFATALLDLADSRLPPEKVSLLCQQAEIRYAGVKCGVMDQFAVNCCESGNAMLLDCRDLSTRQVRLGDSFHLLLTHSGVNHKLPDGDYNQRADECLAATEILAAQAAAVKSLRDATPDTLETCRQQLGDRLYRRCRHVVSENRRVLDAHAALHDDDAERLGVIVSRSHESLRDDFEVSCKEVDALVEIADSSEGVLGSRMIGGGFGGCVLSIVSEYAAERAMSRIEQRYEKETGIRPWMHRVSSAQPAQQVNAP